MYRLTEKRLSDALPILEKCRAELLSSQRFNAQRFEMELRELWDTGYRELKSIAIQLLRHKRYREIAVFYMENSNLGSGVVTEFQIPLSEVYGIKHFDAPEREAARAAFWAAALDGAK